MGRASADRAFLAAVLQFDRVLLEVSRSLRHVVTQGLLALRRLHVLVVDVESGHRQVRTAEASREYRLAVITSGTCKIALPLFLRRDCSAQALRLAHVTQTGLRRAVVTALARLLSLLQVSLATLLTLMTRTRLLAVAQ